MCKFAHMDEEQRRVRELVTEALRRTGLTATELARRAGVAPSTLTRFLNNQAVKHTLSTRTLAAIERAAGAPPGALASLDPSEAVTVLPVAEIPVALPPGPADVPLYGVASCGTDGDFAVNMVAGPIDYIPRPGRLLRAEKLFAVTAQGSSMEPLYQHGMTVFCREGFPIRENDPVLVELEKGPGAAPLAFLKVYVGQDDRELRLRQLTPPADIVFDQVRVRKIWRALRPQEAM